MHKPLHSFVFRIEYAAASLLVMAGVWVLLLVSAALPEADETSFLNPVFDRIDFLNIQDVSLDAVFAIREVRPPDHAVKIINIGEIAPTPDARIAALLYKLHALGARVIGIDVILDSLHAERFPPDRKQELDMLATALREVPNVVVATTFDAETMQPLHPLLPQVDVAAAHRGYANLVVDPDGVVRRFLPWAEVGGEHWNAWPVEITRLYDSTMVRHVLSFPPGPQIIAYTGTYYEFDIAPIDDVIFSDRYDNGFFDDCIVLVGFVNEGGLFYLGDTHRTPMGHKLGIVGPDMPGVLIHANVIDMLLRDRFIAPIPAWMDWLFVFLLSYVSLAVYRVLRTRPRGKPGAVVLVTTMLFTEAVIVFFIPLIGFFYFGVKISYNLMATAVLLFIPAGSITSWMRVRILHQRLQHRLRASVSPLAPVLRQVFRDDEEFPLRIRLQHGCLYLLHAVLALRLGNMRREGTPLPDAASMPDLQLLRTCVPSIEALFTDTSKDAIRQQSFLRYLFHRKPELLREAWMKNELFLAHLDSYNGHHAWEEWDMLLPHALRLWKEDLADEIERIRRHTVDGSLSDAAPFLLSSPCKVHAHREWFVYAGMVRRQISLPHVPAYYGVDIQCEPVLDGESMRQLQEAGLLHNIEQPEVHQ